MGTLRLAAKSGERDAFDLASGEVDVGVLRLEDEGGGRAQWFWSIHALHLDGVDVDRTGHAPTRNEALSQAEAAWTVMIGSLGLRPE